ncbi:hypothetical protein [Actinomycetospora chiangmaiensis]|uniref:hypothetical protein n=1 Tax=Actinomycetospora chiangmaiensis TaxID=402650 RepID=UPI0003A67B30|nr:hypothetical protein [Actinomycetospora chiangmaiensis]
MDDPEPGTAARATPRRPDAALVGRLLASVVAAPIGAFRATADYETVQGPPPGELPRRFSPFREAGPPPTGNAHDECVIVLEDRDRWRVTTSGGGEYGRAGDVLTVQYPGHAAHEMDVENVRAPSTDWPYYAGHWAEELVLPHRFLGLLDELVVVDDRPARPRFGAAVSLRQPEAYQGIAGAEVLEVEFTVDVALAVIVEAVATTWDRRVSTYALEVLG